MAAPEQCAESTPPGAGQFAATHWTIVFTARRGDDTQAQDALEQLCQAYWFPLYAFVRRQGHSPEDAQDLTQAFFAKLIAKHYLDDVDRSKGKFRSFLLIALKRFLANEWDREHAQKRGGFATVVSIDQSLAESKFGAEPAHQETPEVLFERQWAMALLELVMARLQGECRAEQFTYLRACLTKDDAALPYAEIGARLNMTEAAVKMAVQRLRARYRELLREEIAKTVASPHDIEDELRHLFAVFGT